MAEAAQRLPTAQKAEAWKCHKSSHVGGSLYQAHANRPPSRPRFKLLSHPQEKSFERNVEMQQGCNRMSPDLEPDLCVIGGGAGGVSLALEAAACGLSVALVEKG